MGRYEGRYVFLVRSFVLITLIKCLNGHKTLGLLFEDILYSIFFVLRDIRGEAVKKTTPYFGWVVHLVSRISLCVQNSSHSVNHSEGHLMSCPQTVC